MTPPDRYDRPPQQNSALQHSLAGTHTGDDGGDGGDGGDDDDDDDDGDDDKLANVSKR